MFRNANDDTVTKISWTAPTENEDGSPIEDALTYELYVNDVDTLGFPGVLNPDGKYEFLLASVPGLGVSGQYQLTLTAVVDDVESARSNQITVWSISAPKAITDLGLS